MLRSCQNEENLSTEPGRPTERNACKLQQRPLARSALVQPITVNVGRAGAASLNIVQEVEFVKTEAKVVYILECLQKTPPPVLIFAERKQARLSESLFSLAV